MPGKAPHTRLPFHICWVDRAGRLRLAKAAGAAVDCQRSRSDQCSSLAIEPLIF
jgi:hypothetical protein